MRDTERPSTASLVGDAVQHVTTLFSAELQLARLEATEKVTVVLASIVSIVVAGAVGMVAMLFLLTGVTLAIALKFPLYIAFFIVGGAIALLALITIGIAARNLSVAKLKPHRTLKQVQTAVDLVRSPR